jgi:coenzyme PQQ precursor peptide PqqA
MEWSTPRFEEIALNCEINSYASAALQASTKT